MLILTRKVAEGVVIGDNVRVVVLEVRGKQVRLGIEAPTDMVVLRDEISRRLFRENLQAACFHLGDLPALKESVNGRIKAGMPPSPTLPGVPMMAVKSSQLGTLQVPLAQIIAFDQGILGFNGFHRCVLLARPEVAPFLLLQCVDNPDFALAVVEPTSLLADYRLDLDNSVLSELQAGSPGDLKAFVALTIPPGRPAETTANMASPLLINLSSGLGKQVILENQQYSHKHRLLPA